MDWSKLAYGAVVVSIATVSLPLRIRSSTVCALASSREATSAAPAANRPSAPRARFRRPSVNILPLPPLHVEARGPAAVDGQHVTVDAVALRIGEQQRAGRDLL